MNTLRGKTGTSMGRIINTRRKKRKVLGKSCKYCHHYIPGFCVEFGIDVSSTTNALRCKRYTPKGSGGADYPSEQMKVKPINKLALSVSEFIQFSGMPYDETEIIAMVNSGKYDKLKNKGRLKFHFAKSFGKIDKQLVVKNKDIEIIVQITK